MEKKAIKKSPAFCITAGRSVCDARGRMALRFKHPRIVGALLTQGGLTQPLIGRLLRLFSAWEIGMMVFRASADFHAWCYCYPFKAAKGTHHQPFCSKPVTNDTGKRAGNRKFTSPFQAATREYGAPRRFQRQPPILIGLSLL